jgi:hypothetical protein
MSERAVRWAGGAAIAFVILTLIAVFASGSPPAADDPVNKIRDYFVDNRSTLLLVNLLGLLSIPLVIWFFVVLREVLRGDRTANALGTASLAGVLVTAATVIVGGSLATAPVYVDGVADKLSDDTLRIVFDGQSLMFAAASAGIVVLSLSAALAIRRTGALPAYTMWLGLLATVGNIVALFSTLDAGMSVLGLFGVLTLILFVLAAGIAMAAGKATSAPVAA